MDSRLIDLRKCRPMDESQSYCDKLSKIFGDILYNMEKNCWILTGIEIKDERVEATLVAQNRDIVKKIYVMTEVY